MKNWYYKFLAIAFIAFESGTAAAATPFVQNNAGGANPTATVEGWTKFGQTAFNFLVMVITLAGVWWAWCGLKQILAHLKDKRSQEGTMAGGFGMMAVGIAATVLIQLIRKWSTML